MFFLAAMTRRKVRESLQKLSSLFISSAWNDRRGLRVTPQANCTFVHMSWKLHFSFADIDGMMPWRTNSAMETHQRQRYVIEFLDWEWNGPIDILRGQVMVYGVDAVDTSTVRWWSTGFRAETELSMTNHAPDVHTKPTLQRMKGASMNSCARIGV